MMIVAGLLSCLIVCSSYSSASLYGEESYGGEEWWTHRYFLKFFSPSGKNYFIDYTTGELSLESSASMQDSVKDVTSPPYISFVSLDTKVYDIFFEHNDGVNYTPQIVEKQVNWDAASIFIRHSLHSFVGPDKQIYTLTYNNISSITIASEKSAKPNLDSLQIKTFGPYSKCEHTYSFSENGDTATDLTLSPVEVSEDRWILLPEMETAVLRDGKLLLASLNTPSGKRYLVTNNLDMARDEAVMDGSNQSYITFVEPNGAEYDIFFRKDGSEFVANMVTKENGIEDYQHNYKLLTVQLLSFVGPDKKCYRIDRRNESGVDVPVLDSTTTESTDFRVTFAVSKNSYFKNYVKFIFSNEGNELHDRVDELDLKVIAAQPPLGIDEVDVDSEIAKSSFLTFYSPSGRIYYLTPNDTKANFAVAKESNTNSDSPYLSYVLEDGRKSNIYIASNGQIDMRFSPADAADATNSPTKFFLQSFVTPDKKFYKVLSNVENDIKIPYIDITPQPRDPLDQKQEEALRIVIATTAKEYNYLFTWNGDKLIDVITVPRKRVSHGVLKSLIGK